MEMRKRPMSDPRRGLTREILLTILVLAILLFVVLNSVRYFTRIDLTESKAYSISDVSRNLFEEIPENVQITYYVSERLQERFPQPQEIVDLLSEYTASSRGTITLTIENPGAEGAQVDAEALGIVPQQLQVAEQGEQIFAVVYSGIVMSYLDRYEAIPFVFGVTTLEYEITSTIRDLVADRTKALRILVGYPDRTIDTDYSFAASQLSQAYDVREQTPGEPVPDDVDLLVVVGGESLSPEALLPVDEYLTRGGSVLMAVDSARVDIAGGLSASSVADAAVFSMLESYGVTVGSELVLDEAYNQIVIQESGSGYSVQRLLPYPHWISVLEQYTSVDHPVTSRFTGLDLYWPTYLELSDGADGEIIVASTSQAWLMAEPYRTNPQESGIFRITADETRGQYGFVAVVTGLASGADWTGGRLMVVADADFLSSRLIQATQSGHNLGFLESSAQWLTNDEELLEIRTRAARDLRLNAFEDPAQKRAFVVFAQALNIYVVPAVVIVVGIIRFLRRRRRASTRGAER